MPSEGWRFVLEVVVTTQRKHTVPSYWVVGLLINSVERVLFMQLNGPLRWNFGFDQQQLAAENFCPTHALAAGCAVAP